jgi:hypothetical protein
MQEIEMTIDEAFDRLAFLQFKLRGDPSNEDAWAEYYAINEAFKTVKPVREFPTIKITT